MTKPVALVFGATSGIGLAIARSLMSDYEVFGIGRDISKLTLEGVKLISCDLCDPRSEAKLMEELKSTYKISCPDLIVFSAGAAYYGLHETLSKENISEMVACDLLSPMRITNHYLSQMKSRKRGQLIYISSVTADRINPHGASYGACKAGLRSFALSLFEEVRKYDIKVNLISPDLTSTDLYRNADIAVDEDLVLKPEDVAAAVDFAVSRSQKVDIFDIVIRPMRNAVIKK